MADEIDRANELAEKQQQEALDRHQAEQNRLAKIRESMKPADPSTPKPCADCGANIDPERLRLMPYALRCVRCGDLAEKRYREQAWMPR